MLLLVWVFLGLMMTGQVLSLFGIKFLLLLPEYLGETETGSYFILGCAFGALIMTWNLVTYLVYARRFPFLSALSRPFTKFALNNSLVPLLFLLLFFVASARLQYLEAGFTMAEIVLHLGSFLLGMFAILIIIALYLSITNQDIRHTQHYLKDYEARKTAFDKGQKASAANWGVETYLSERFRPRLVRSVAHYDQEFLKGIYRQNHLNALLLQIVSILLLTIIGHLVDNPVFRIPAGASLLIMASIVLSLFGAITYWFGPWRLLIFLLMIISLDLITSSRAILQQTQAYGLDYLLPDKPAYTNAALAGMLTQEQMQEDQAEAQLILDKWKSRQSAEKPKLVLLAASGGGLKAAVWTMQTIQQLEQTLPDSLMRKVGLMTGASGGVIGLAYLRALWQQEQEGKIMNYTDRTYLERMSGDLLNSVAISMASTDMFGQGPTLTLDSMRYRKDRGHTFELQLNENTDYALAGRLGDFRMPERQAIIPQLLITPTIINDGRRLIISPQGVSYLCRAPAGQPGVSPFDIDGVDFRQFFGAQRADYLQMTSALRMNAAFPYILPAIGLPSVPVMDIMDAGIRDNFGISIALRYLLQHKEWIKENTSGVVMINIRCWEKTPRIASPDRRGFIGELTKPFGLLGDQSRFQDFAHDSALSMMADVLGPDMFHVVRFVYEPGKKQAPASLSLHLTKREKEDILNAWTLPHNQAALREVERLLME